MTMRRFLLLQLLGLVAVFVAPAAAPGAEETANNGKLVAKLMGPTGTDVAFSHDGKRILTAGGDAARVWDATTFNPVTEPLRHAQGKTLLLASISRDGTKVLTAAGDEAWVWDANTGRRTAVLRHGGKIRCAAFSPEGGRMAVGGDDGVLQMWALGAHGGRLLLTLRHEQACRSVAFSPNDGATLLTVEAEPGAGGALRLWDAATGRELWDSIVGGVASYARRPAAFAPDGKRVAWTPHAAVYVADARNGAQDRPDVKYGFDRRIVDGVDFSPDGTTLLVITGNLALLDTKGKDLRLRCTVPTEGVRDATFSPDGRYIVIASSYDHSGVWDVMSGRRVLSLPPRVLYDEKMKPAPRVIRQDGRPAFAYEVPVVAFSPDGRRVAAGFGSDGFTGVWTVTTDQLERGQANAGTPLTLVLSADQLTVAAGNAVTITEAVQNVTDREVTANFRRRMRSVTGAIDRRDGRREYVRVPGLPKESHNTGHSAVPIPPDEPLTDAYTVTLDAVGVYRFRSTWVSEYPPPDRDTQMWRGTLQSNTLEIHVVPNRGLR